MSDSGHPSRHGFVRCDWCHRWRRKSGVAVRDGLAECRDDVRGCSEWMQGVTPKRPSSPVVSETAPNPGWDANGAPIEQGEAT